MASGGRSLGDVSSCLRSFAVAENRLLQPGHIRQGLGGHRIPSAPESESLLGGGLQGTFIEETSAIRGPG